MLRPLLSSTFPQEFQISKKNLHPTSGSGGKIGLEIYDMKRDKDMDGHRDSMMELAQWADSIKIKL